MTGEITATAYQPATVIIAKQKTSDRTEMRGTLFRRDDIINGIIDDELEVLIQQGVYQRGVGYALSICQKRTDVQLSTLSQSYNFIF